MIIRYKNEFESVEVECNSSEFALVVGELKKLTIFNNNPIKETTDKHKTGYNKGPLKIMLTKKSKN